MDYNSALASVGVSTSTLLILGLIYKVFGMIRGRRLISDCCGRHLEVGVDVRDMPPTPPTPGGNETRLMVEFPEEESYQNQPESVLEPSVSHPATRKGKSVRMLQPPRAEEAESVPAQVVPATSEPKRSAELSVSGAQDSVFSLPPTLEG